MAPLSPLKWHQWRSPFSPKVMGCTIGAISGIAIGDNGSPFVPFFVAIGANGEMSNSL